MGQLPAAASAGVKGAEQSRAVSGVAGFLAAVAKGAERSPPANPGGSASQHNSQQDETHL